jgi:predicted protein tyrosine phosphatase
MRSISILTICGIEELPALTDRRVTHVLSVLDPDLPEIEAFRSYGDHSRTTLRFHDIIDEQEGRVAPQPRDVAAIVRFGTDLAASRASLSDGHLVVHCHAGVSRSTAAMLTLLAQANPDESEDRLHERLRQIRPQAWPNSRMVIFADDQLGRNGRLVQALRRHYGYQLKANPNLKEQMTQGGRGREVEMAL